MIEQIREIASLQTKYSSSNTPEMARRGVLIRSELPKAIKLNWNEYLKAIGNFSSDLEVEGKDGIGRKTQAPWVRVYSKSLSPSATNGFYVVLHFSTDGKFCFITIGCGASKWDTNKGDLVNYSDGEIQLKVDWALNILSRNNKDISLFSDKIDIGSPHSLPKSFEKATVLCKTFEISLLHNDKIKSTICKALELLSTIYEYCSELNDLAQSDISKSEIESVINPNKNSLNTRQGYALSSTERKAVEIRAMEVTQDYLISLGYTLKDTSLNRPYDYLAVNDEISIKVEVKGTTSAFVDSIMMTSNEVDLHTTENGETALAIVSNIEFIQRGENAK